ncbi:MAG TPA: Dabb family protein [Panacibacter sp.]|nr:Dabb family protein [Panacibacter sp.]HNP44644.1 Dabb family protein [Panacibacter sp.]
MQLKNIFVHHVYFWLHNADSEEDKKALLRGLEKLATVATIDQYHIGTAAPTRREVIDSSYTASWLAIFKTAADQDSYQIDPIHLEFISECSHLWSRVLVYDAIDAAV